MEIAEVTLELLEHALLSFIFVRLRGFTNTLIYFFFFQLLLCASTHNYACLLRCHQ